MTIINPKSISGITSITTASGADNLLTVHTNNTTERVRINNDGDVIVGSGITVSPDGDIFTTGVTTATTFVGALTGNVTGNATGLSGTPNISAGTIAGSTGTFTGNITASSSNIKTGDSNSSTNNRLQLGAATYGDLELYHDGTSSYIDNATNDLFIRNTGDDITIQAADDITIAVQGGENAVVAYGDGAVELYNNNVKKFETSSSGVTISGDNSTGSYIKGVARFTPNDSTTVKVMWDEGGYSGAGHFQIKDNVALSVGDSSDLKIYHDASNTRFVNSTGALVFQADTVNFNDTANGDSKLQLISNAGVLLYYDNSPKLETTNEGTKITGYLKSTSNGTIVQTGTYHESYQTNNNQHTHWFHHAGSTSGQQYGIRIKSESDGNDTINQIQCSSGGATAFVVRRNGSVESRNNSYGGVSDIKLKENIVDANSQWDDIKNIKVRNFNFKDNPTKTMIGVVAQEIELVSAGLVEDIPDLDDTNADLGTVTKVVKSSILYMKAIKALQESMARIEVLETRLNNAGIAT